MFAPYRHPPPPPVWSRSIWMLSPRSGVLWEVWSVWWRSGKPRVTRFIFYFGFENTLFASGRGSIFFVGLERYNKLYLRHCVQSMTDVVGCTYKVSWLTVVSSRYNWHIGSCTGRSLLKEMVQLKINDSTKGLWRKQNRVKSSSSEQDMLEAMSVKAAYAATMHSMQTLFSLVWIHRPPSFQARRIFRRQRQVTATVSNNVQTRQDFDVSRLEKVVLDGQPMNLPWLTQRCLLCVPHTS